MPRSCPDCGCPLQDNAKFCTTCGKPVDHSPPQKPRCACCGAELKETSKFCLMCGKPVVPAAQASAANISSNLIFIFFFLGLALKVKSW